MDLTQETIAQLSKKLHKKEITSEELTNAYFARIEEFDKKLNCYLHLGKDQALKSAKAADKRLQKGENVRPLTGVPLGLKDIFITEGMPTTCGSKILKNYIPPYDGTTSKRLKEEGGVILGKLNMDEFAMGSSNEFSGFGPVANPWNADYVPGGSSGGSAAAMAADLCAGSFGTDTGGSIRQPASFCGVVGIKPTYGRVTRFGLIAFASSLDQAGPMGKSVEDVAILLNAIAGFDPKDSTSLNIETPDFTQHLKKDIKGMKLGLPKEYYAQQLDAEVKTAFDRALKEYENLGAIIEEVSLPHTEYAVPTYYIIAPAEASSNLARYDGVRYGVRESSADSLTQMYETTRAFGFGPEVTLRILLGTFALSSGYYDAYYLKAQKVRTLIKQDFINVFKKVDALITPTSPTPAFKKGEKSQDPLKMYLNDIFTIPAPLAGVPAISLPCGFTKENLPIGLQLIGKHLDEATLFQLANAYEKVTNWHKQRPHL